MLNADGSFTYTLEDTSFAGDDTFTYKVLDGTDFSSVATVTIQVAQLRIKDGDDFPFGDVFANDVTGQTAATTDGFKKYRRLELANAHGHAIKNVNWTVSGDAIADYKIKTNTVTELTPDDLSAISLAWYWVAESDLQTVTVTATVDGIAGTATTYFDAIRPSATVDDIIMKDPVVYTKIEQGAFGPIESTFFGLGGDGQNGITLNPHGNGTFAWIQVLDDTYATRSKDGYVEYNRHFNLYDSPIGDVRYPTGSTLTDSPREPFQSAWDSQSRADHFTAYLMCMPTNGGIYVPVGKVGWTWSATVSKAANGTFKVDSSSKSNTDLTDETSYPPHCSGHTEDLIVNPGWQVAS